MNNPICVDLDGTLINTDSLIESIIKLCKTNPFYLFSIFYWRIRGKAYLKNKVAILVSIKSETLPYNEKVLQYIRKAKEENHPLFLVTGANEAYAKSVADHLGCFEKVFASDGKINLTGKNKRRALIQAFGEKGFIYIGNSRDDLPIWKASKEALFVNTPRSVQQKIEKTEISNAVLDQKSISLKTILKQLRVHQWVKNTLLFVPLLTAHDFQHIWSGILAFFSFSFLSSAIYIINDLCDLDADRQHVSKKFRPMASGDLPIQYGLFLTCLLFPLSFYLAHFLPREFLIVLLGYLLINIGYNALLKTKAIIDVLCLASLYLLRILGGHAMTGIQLSSWLITFALFFFLSLALIKRYTELSTKQKAEGRGYDAADVQYLGTLGLTSSAISILVFAFYLNSDHVVKIYIAPKYLWLFIPLLFYWISRLWLKAFRYQMHDDPIVFALKDRISHYILVAMLCVTFLAYHGLPEVLRQFCHAR